MGSIGNPEGGILAVVLGLADYIPRVSKRTGDSVNTFGPNIQPTSSDGPDALSEHLYLLPCDLYLLSADSHNDTHSLCFQILVKSSSALPSHSFAMLNKSAECLRHISSHQSKYCISAGCIGQYLCPVKHHVLSYSQGTSNHSNRCANLVRSYNHALMDRDASLHGSHFHPSQRCGSNSHKFDLHSVRQIRYETSSEASERSIHECQWNSQQRLFKRTCIRDQKRCPNSNDKQCCILLLD